MLAFDPLSWQAFGDHHPQSIILPGQKVRECGLLWINCRWAVIGGLYWALFRNLWWFREVLDDFLGWYACYFSLMLWSYGLNEWLSFDLNTEVCLASVSGCLQPDSITLRNALMWFDGRPVRLCGPGWKVWPRLMSWVIRSEHFKSTLLSLFLSSGSQGD